MMTATTNQIPLFSAKIANQSVDLTGPVSRVIDSHWYVLGKEVSAFETEFAQYLGVEHCVSVANGTDALELALRAVGVQKGDVVATVANAGFYSSTAIHAIGAIPLFVDCDDATLTMSCDALTKALKHKPKAVVVTHLYGQLAAIEKLVSIAENANVPLIEDCAQSHGALRHGKQAGSFGTIASFSFYPTKNLGALGDGGAVVTGDSDLAERTKTLRQYGWSHKYQVAVPGGRNSRLDEMQAAILREKLPHLDAWNASRRQIAARYNREFAQLALRRPSSVNQDYVAHLYVLRVKQRDAFRGFLGQRGITTDVHYPIPDHQQPAYATSAVEPLDVTLIASGEVVSLPCFPGLSDSDVQRVVSAVQDYFKQ